MSYLKTISDDSKVIEVPLLVTECTLTFVRPTAPSSNIHQCYATVKVRWAWGTWVTDDCFPLIACLSYQWLPNNASARQKSARLFGYRTHRKFRVTTEYRVHTLFISSASARLSKKKYYSSSLLGSSMFLFVFILHLSVLSLAFTKKVCYHQKRCQIMIKSFSRNNIVSTKTNYLACARVLFQPSF